MARLQAGEAQLEAGEDAALGRTRSLAASLSYGFAQAFTEAERAQLAVLHLFRDTADADALRYMGDPDIAGEDAVPELAGLDRDAGSRCWTGPPASACWNPSAAATTGSTPRCRGISPPCSPPATARPAARPPAAPPAPTPGPSANSATTTTSQAEAGHAAQVVPVLGAEEANLRHALDLARAAGLWHAAAGCLQGLRVLYERTGRDGEWARLVAAVTPDFTDPATGGPLPGREDQWSLVTGYRVRLARQARDWPAATTLQNAVIAWDRDQAAAALAAPAASLTPDQRNQIRNLAVALKSSGTSSSSRRILAACRYYQEALALDQRIGDRPAEAQDRWQPRQRLPDGARAAGPGPGRALVPAQPQPARRQRPARPRQLPQLSSARSPWGGSTTPAPRARPSRCCWSTSTPPSATTSKPWT